MQQFLQGIDGVPCAHLIVDEVHNRSISDDVFLAVVKHHALTRNKQLKVILMSAATDDSKLAQYFCDENNGPAEIVSIENSLYRVDVLYLDEIDFFRHRGLTSPLEPKAIADFIWYLHTSSPPRSKLFVFLPGRGIIIIKKITSEFGDIQEDFGDHVLDIGYKSSACHHPNRETTAYAPGVSVDAAYGDFDNEHC